MLTTLQHCFGDERAIAADFQTIRALVSGKWVSTMMGFQFHILGDRDEGGLSIDGSSDRTCFAFHQSAVGVAVGICSHQLKLTMYQRRHPLVTGQLYLWAVSLLIRMGW